MNSPEAAVQTPVQDPARTLATLVQLMRRAREADGEDALGFVMVNESLRLLFYRQAALWREGPLGRVAALSGLAETDPAAPYVQWLASVFKALAAPADAAAAPVRAVGATELPPVLAEEWAGWLPAHGLWLRLPPTGGHPGGALLLARDQPWSDYERTLAAELADAYAHAQARFAPQRNWRDRLGGWVRPGKTRRRILLGLLLLACCPVRLTVLARAEVTPQEPFLVRAPLSGVIDRIDVQPNQRVAAGAPLFSLDQTQLAGQYALADKAREAAQEAYRQSAQLAVTDDRGKLEMAMDRAKLDEKAIEADYTGRQLARISVKAAREGVVVFSDRNDWQGRAVSVGEKVMTLADPARVELTAFLPAAEAIRIAPGGTVRLYPNASPTESYDATITRVAYRAEPTEEGILAYRIHARFEQADALPRIGQMGTARVYGDWVPLVYYALRRPLTWARQWLGL